MIMIMSSLLLLRCWHW